MRWDIQVDFASFYISRYLSYLIYFLLFITGVLNMGNKVYDSVHITLCKVFKVVQTLLS